MSTETETPIVDTDSAIVISAMTRSLLKKHGLDFSILKEPMKIDLKGDGGKGIKVIDTPYYGLVNTATQEVINSVSDRYHVAQNENILEMVVRGLEGYGELKIVKAGSLHGGRKIFIQIAVAGVNRIGNDKVTRIITVINSNDGSTNLSVGIGDITASCTNEFYRFYKQGEMSFRHTPSLAEMIKEFPSRLAFAMANSMKLIEAYHQLQATEIQEAVVHKMVKELLGFDRVYTPEKDLNKKTKKALNNMDKLYETIDLEIKDKGLNLWGLHSGITRWTTHVKEAPRRENGRLDGIISPNGVNYKFNQKSLNFVLKQAGIKLAI